MSDERYMVDISNLRATIETMKAGAKVTIRERVPHHDGVDRALVVDGYRAACDDIIALLAEPAPR